MSVPMDDEARLLELIEERVVEHGGGLDGWTARSGGELTLFAGRISLRAEMVVDGDERRVHAHVFATLHDCGGEVLEACILGMGEDRDAALGQAAVIWMQGVGAPVRSFLDDRDVCMASRMEVGGGRAFAGPMFPRGLDEPAIAALDDALPWFRYAAASAAPRRVHLAKVSISTGSGTGWTRHMEIDGHDISHTDADWPAGVASSSAGYVTRFAVFELAPDEVARRAELDRTILHFAGHYARHGSVDELVDEMVRQGFDPDLVHETEMFSTLAFGRHFFEPRGVAYPPTIIRARASGRVEPDVPLLSIPAYSRARALAPRLERTPAPDEFASLCCHSAESAAILKVMESDRDVDLAALTLFPCAVPDRVAAPETMDAALRLQRRAMDERRPPPAPARPWWKLW